MKKSVLLPYERYQQLIQDTSSSSGSTTSAAAVTANPDHKQQQQQQQQVIRTPKEEDEEEIETPAASVRQLEDHDDDDDDLNSSSRTLKLENDVIVACLPKRNSSKARRLLEYINKHSGLDWNQQGNIIVDSGERTVDFSHIVDLLHDALNATKHNPVGYAEFYKHLNRAPLSLINNQRRKSLIGGGGGGGVGAAVVHMPPPGLPPVSKPSKPLNAWKTEWKPL